MGEAGADVGRGGAPPRRGAVYVDDAIWEWRGLRGAPLLADDTGDLHRFAAAPRVHRPSDQGPPRTAVPPSHPPARQRPRAPAYGAIACSREEIVALVRRMRSSCGARGAEAGS